MSVAAGCSEGRGVTLGRALRGGGGGGGGGGGDGASESEGGSATQAKIVLRASLSASSLPFRRRRAGADLEFQPPFTQWVKILCITVTSPPHNLIIRSAQHPCSKRTEGSQGKARWRKCRIKINKMDNKNKDRMEVKYNNIGMEHGNKNKEE